MSFEEYLKEKRFLKRTINYYLNQIEQFKNWLERENIEESKLKYNDIIAYVSYLKRENSNRTINLKIGVVRMFLNFRNVKSNPADGVILKGVKRIVLNDTLSEEELNHIYESMGEATIYEKRNKVIIGLAVFQGLSKSEIIKLRVDDIHLKKGSVYIRSSKRANSRELKLESIQIFSVLEYLNEIRPQLLLLNEKEDKVFVNNGKDSQYVLGLISSELSVNGKKVSLKQIRISVISNWLKKENLRIVQYKAGHRYVSSTERYKMNNMQELKKQIEEYHPLD